MFLVIFTTTTLWPLSSVTFCVFNLDSFRRFYHQVMGSFSSISTTGHGKTIMTVRGLVNVLKPKTPRQWWFQDSSNLFEKWKGWSRILVLWTICSGFKQPFWKVERTIQDSRAVDHLIRIQLVFLESGKDDPPKCKFSIATIISYALGSNSSEEPSRAFMSSYYSCMTCKWCKHGSPKHNRCCFWNLVSHLRGIHVKMENQTPFDRSTNRSSQRFFL